MASCQVMKIADGEVEILVEGGTTLTFRNYNGEIRKVSSRRFDRGSTYVPREFFLEAHRLACEVINRRQSALL